MAETVIPPIVFTLWRVALVAAYVILLPTAVYWLHTLWRTSNSIRTYTRACAEAAEAIERNAAALPALDATIAIATEVLTAAGAVAGKLDAAASALEARARG
jgi:hypothetical protein